LQAHPGDICGKCFDAKKDFCYNESLRIQDHRKIQF
jgi:hypothetical protein